MIVCYSSRDAGCLGLILQHSDVQTLSLLRSAEAVYVFGHNPLGRTLANGPNLLLGLIPSRTSSNTQFLPLQ
jgi:hypothetical protein